MEKCFLKVNVDNNYCPSQRSRKCVPMAGNPLLPSPFRLLWGPWKGTQLSCVADSETKIGGPEPRDGRLSSGIFTVRSTAWQQRELILSWSHRSAQEVYRDRGWEAVDPQGIWNWRKPWKIQELEDERALWWLAPATPDSGIPMTKGCNQGSGVTVHQLQAVTEFPSFRISS